MKFIFRAGRHRPKAPVLPPSWWVPIAGVGAGSESVPHSLRRKGPHQPEIRAPVQPLLASTSLSNHLMFTSSVHTLAEGFQVD